jgi:hypothetical protein
MTTIASYGRVAVEEHDRGFAVTVTTPEGTTVRVGPLFERKYKALRFALEMAEVAQ